MDIQSRYQTVLTELKNGGRGLQKFSEQDIQDLIGHLETDRDKIPALCLITHASHPSRHFEAPLLKCLQQELGPDEIIYALNAARKHIMQARFKEGFRLEMEFLENLRVLLHHSDLSVVEWTLRTVEECGAQGVLLATDVAQLRPSVFSLWRAQNRTILELVTFLLRRWNLPNDQKR